MKGITPVVAIVLLLAITISIVAFTYIYFQRIVQEGIEKSSEQIENVGYGKAAVIDAIDTSGGNVKVYLRLAGTSSVKEDEIIVYINGVPESCSLFDMSGNDIEELNSTVSVGYCNTTATSCNKVKISTPGNTDEKNC